MPLDDRTDRAAPDDTRLRLLFTHPRMVRDLFLGFVREPWVERLDFAALEPWGESAAGPDLSWRLRFQGGRGWIHLLLALAPEVDRTLPVRLAGRIVMLLLELARQGGLPRSRRLPAVVPLVLYHGEALWTVPRQLADLFDPVPHGLERTLPRLSPLVLDVRREPLPETAARDNLAALLFALERSRSLADLDRGVARLATLLPGPLTGPLADLRRDFTRYLRDDLLPRRFGGLGTRLDLVGGGSLEAAGPVDLEEVTPLLRETVGSWTRHFREEGRRQGAAELLGRLLDQRFGPLDALDRARLGEAGTERLLDWGERALTAASLPEVFG
ncbi:MAG TPA: Rpn family recombination-promoting nuclease/putative transposase [Thermoanaerobaculia bacterium]|nr:Rpn family recombination-promoting nuclease/putative transposase [Thermoanaerobaculia bacterium]